MANNKSLVDLSQSLAKKLNIESSTGLIDVLKNTAFKGGKDNVVDDNQMMALLIVANQYGLSPWTKEIYAYPDKNNGIVPVVGVDGWVKIMNEHPQYNGIEFTENSESCTCTIYRKDREYPTVVTEWMSECYRDKVKTRQGYLVDTPWQSHPKRMLRHKAMIQCARIAFGFSGIKDQDEAEVIIANGEVINHQTSEAENSLPQLEKGTNEWDRAIAALKINGNLNGVKQHRTILPEDEKELYLLAGVEPNVVDAEYTEAKESQDDDLF